MNHGKSCNVGLGFSFMETAFYRWRHLLELLWFLLFSSARAIRVEKRGMLLQTLGKVIVGTLSKETICRWIGIRALITCCARAHTYEHTLKELRKYEPYVRIGGIITLHDIISFPEVMTAISDYVENRRDLRVCSYLNNNGLAVIFKGKREAIKNIEI